MIDLYCVIHRHPDYNRTKAAEYLAGERCLDMADALRQEKLRPGFLLSDASLAKAAPFNLRASAAGFETLLLSQNDLYRLPIKIAITAFEFKADAFYFIHNGKEIRTKFDDIKLLTATACDIEKAASDTLDRLKNELAADLRLKYFSLTLPENNAMAPGHTLETIFQADIITKDKNPVRLTISEDNFDFSCLGSAKTASSYENFRMLIKELAARCLKAGQNTFLKSLILNNILIKSPTPEAYENELMWLSTISSNRSDWQ